MGRAAGGRRRARTCRPFASSASRSTSRSSVTVRVGGETRTFKDGEGVTFPRNAGGRRTLRPSTASSSPATASMRPAPSHSDFRGQGRRGRRRRLARGRRARQRSISRPTGGCSPAAAATRPSSCSAAATIGPEGAAGAPARACRRAGADRHRAGLHDGAAPRPARCRRPSRRRDSVFEFLFSRAPARYDELKRKAEAREPLPSFRLDDVTLTFNIDVDYDGRPHAAHAERRRHRRGQRSGAEGHLRRVRRALRSRRLRRSRAQRRRKPAPARPAA